MLLMVGGMTLIFGPSAFCQETKEKPAETVLPKEGAGLADARSKFEAMKTEWEQVREQQIQMIREKQEELEKLKEEIFAKMEAPKSPAVEQKTMRLASTEEELFSRKKALDEQEVRLEQKRKALDARDREMNQKHVSTVPPVSPQKHSAISVKEKSHGQAVLIPSIKNSKKSGMAGPGDFVKEKSKIAASAAQ